MKNCAKCGRQDNEEQVCWDDYTDQDLCLSCFIESMEEMEEEEKAA